MSARPAAQTALNAAIIVTLLFTPGLSMAQMLEEIVVTAQRREQSLQEVPISIESFGGAELQQQGYRNLDDLANFSATVLVSDEGFLSQERTIRGFGTSGNALTLEQAVPIFIDGIHYGRAAQVKTAFLDLERIEVLKGPQPVFFGMSATAGAFNIRSARPTPEWEAYLDSEYGNNHRAVVEGAVGGPLFDTLGMRVAGKYESSEGFMTDVITGNKIGGYEQLGGRAILQWTPTDNFEARWKLEGSSMKRNSEAVHICLTQGSLIYGRRGPTQPSDEGDERSVWADPPKGEGWVVDHAVDDDCFGSDKGLSYGEPFFAPPINIREENMVTGAIDAREAVSVWNKLLWERTGGSAGSPYGLEAVEEIDSMTGYMDLVYTLGNGIEINFLTGYSDYKRLNTRDNSASPFFVNGQDRVEIFDQWSSELRFTSAPGGTIEWMAGLFWQKMDYDITSNSTRPNTRRGLRFNDIIWEDQEWKSAFASLTFNFLDNRASIDVGGRYVDLEKTGAIYGVAGMWIFDEMPCAGDEDVDHLGFGNLSDTNPATCTPHPAGVQISANDAEFLLPGADTNNLWITDYAGSRVTPVNWRSPQRQAVGLFIYPNRTVNTLGGPEDGEGLRREPFTPERGGTFSSSEFDPQVTLRYRISDNHSVFARWAEAFKAGGFDTGVSSINRTVEDFRFEPETAETFELGAKGNLFENRARYDVTVFETNFYDFQITVPTGNLDDPFLNANAGHQRVRGVEFNLTSALTEQLTASLSGALMNGEMVFFPAGGCTPEEAQTAPESGCVLEDPDDFTEGGTIDRSGQEAPRTPDYKFVLTLDYWMPVFDNHRLTFNAKGYVSDGYITDINGFGQDVKYNTHEDLNLILGFGDINENWTFSVWGRNLLEARQSYNPEFDVLPDGLLTPTMSPNNFLSYGVKFRYNFQ